MSNSPDVNPAFEDLLAFLRDERGFDFTGYKRPSLMRRISKRMQDLDIPSYEAYRTFLANHPDEFVDLFNTILINVTSFFRDQNAWDYLHEEIVPRIVEPTDGTANEQIRIWSTGCASGEEAYTTAMIFAEVMGEDTFRRRVKIYATDIDEEALSKGRHGEYDSKEMEPVPAELRDRYFERVNSNYTFRPDLRRSVIFGRHDLVQDPPISKISLLLSRNTLMYFDTNTQKRILGSFHFSLRDDGFLFLGKSEALAARTDLFAAVELKRRVFAKLPVRRPPRLEMAVPAREDTLGRLANETMIREAGFEAVPVAQIVIDRDGVLALANLQARAFFGISPTDVGRPFQDLEISFRPVELRSRIEQVYAERHLIALRDVEWHVDGDTRFVDVQIAPLVGSTGDTLGVGITFAEVTRYRRLQDALQESKREMETAYEELQSTVEELETTNEELQSTNEELETTNEELQSTNEELETMNDELNERSVEWNQANSFLGAVLGSLQAGVVVMNDELVIQAWNSGARELWGLTSDEVVGTHLLNLDIGLPLEEIRKPLRQALSGDGNAGKDLAVRAVNRRGREVLVKVTVTPMENTDGGVEGVILMMQPSEDGAGS